MRRTITLTRSLGAGLLLAFALVLTVIPSPRRESLSSDLGLGWRSALACIGCAAGGLALASMGPGALLLAAHVPGSTIAVVGCALTCYDAIAG